MSTIDWSKAPEGATHFDPVDQNWLMQFLNVSFGWLASEGWTTKGWQYPNDLSTMQRLISRPAWDGSGMPPVGVKCEVEHGGEWIDCEVIAHFQQESAPVAAFIFSPYSGQPKCKELSYYVAASFRPARTPEQIAADERLHEIRNALTTIKAGQQQFPNDLVRGNITLSVVEAMIDAGYRKQVMP
jgi:hypothetical protein